MTPKTFVLVHGAWHGGWCWSRVAGILRERGHRVTTPTQTGLGERAHLLSPGITLDTFIQDIISHLKWNDLDSAVLVGHSFGGLSITGAADAIPERIARLIYLDAVIPENGKSAFDGLPPEITASRLKAASETSGGLSLPAPRPEKFGLSAPGDLAFVANRLTPHPLATFQNPIRLNHATGNGLPCAAIECTDPAYLPMAASHHHARDLGWPVFPLATGHDAMVSAPQALAALLEKTSV